MYRAVALAAVERDVDLSDAAALVVLAGRLNVDLRGDRVFLDGADVTEAIRTSRITGVTHYAADNRGVRAILVEWQRRAAGRDNVVSEGRDQGTVVFPNAECKIFLVASPEERARRRQQDLAARGEPMTLEVILVQQNQRDARDAARTVGPMVPAADAITFTTDGLSREEVVERLEAIVHEKMSDARASQATR
jgi:cytidylate kinase